MRAGDRAHVFCVPNYAYGKQGFPKWGIQPDSIVLFDIELLNFV